MSRQTWVFGKAMTRFYKSSHIYGIKFSLLTHTYLTRVKFSPSKYLGYYVLYSFLYVALVLYRSIVLKACGECLLVI